MDYIDYKRRQLQEKIAQDKARRDYLGRARRWVWNGLGRANALDFLLLPVILFAACYVVGFVIFPIDVSFQETGGCFPVTFERDK